MEEISDYILNVPESRGGLFGGLRQTSDMSWCWFVIETKVIMVKFYYDFLIYNFIYFIDPFQFMPSPFQDDSFSQIMNAFSGNNDQGRESENRSKCSICLLRILYDSMYLVEYFQILRDYQLIDVFMQ